MYKKYQSLPQKHKCNLTSDELRKLDELRPYWFVKKEEPFIQKEQRKPMRVRSRKVRPHQPSLF